jgi:hypothetical protein
LPSARSGYSGLGHSVGLIVGTAVEQTHRRRELAKLPR